MTDIVFKIDILIKDLNVLGKLFLFMVHVYRAFKMVIL